MIKKRIIIILFITAVITVAGVLFVFGPEDQTQLTEKRITSYQVDPEGNTGTYLYFLDKGGNYLTGEERPFLFERDPYVYGKSIVQEIIKGPKGELIPTIPSNTVLKAFYITKEGMAIVDLSENIESTHQGGSSLEYFTIFSIVNSLILNVTEIKTVKFLKGGCEALTLAGHIDIRLPFKANMLLVR